VRIVFLVFFILLTSISANAYYLNVIVVDAKESKLDLPSYKTNPKDSVETLLTLQKLIIDLHEQAYVLANLDSLIYTSDTIHAFIYRGEPFKWVTLKRGNVDEYILNKIGYRERFYRNKPFKIKEYHKLEVEIIKLSENNGYPFAFVALDSIQIQHQKILAQMNYQKGPMFTFDSIMIIGKSKTKKKYLMRHLRISIGQTYSHQRVTESERLIKELPFLSQKKPPEVLFSKNKAMLYLFLEDKKINQVDGIVGFLPGEGTNKKLLITGELNLGLRNLMGTGKNLNVEWKKIKQASQTLDMNYLQPKLLGSGVDVRINFNLFKRDSTFLTIVRKLTFIQRTGINSKVNINVGLKTSRPLDGITDTTGLKSADYNYYTYGLGYERNTLNDIFYPRKGWFFSLNGTVGNKTIRPNPSFKLEYYDNTQLKSVQILTEALLERYTKLGKGSVLLTKLSWGRIFNKKENLFFNDLYQIGGLRTLRGFNENNFYASTYGIGTIEYRFFTDETSYLLLFYDQGYIVNDLIAEKKYDYPLGFGAGVSFTTAAGVFNFVYSVGQSNTQKLNLNLSKIHFGITSRF